MTTPRVYVSSSPNLLAKASAVFDRIARYGVAASFDDPRGAVVAVWVVEGSPAGPPPPSIAALAQAGFPTWTVAVGLPAGAAAEPALNAADEDFPERFGTLFFEAAGLNEASRVVLQGGVQVDAFATLPADLSGTPCLPLPSSGAPDAWADVQKALSWMRRALPRVREVMLAGCPSRGLAALVGATWTRSSGVELQVLDIPRRPRPPVFKVPPSDANAPLIASFSPQDATALRLMDRPPNSTAGGALTLAFLPRGTDEARRWCLQRNPHLALFELAAEPPLGSRSLDKLLATCEGALRWARRTFDPDTIDLLFGLQESVASLLFHELSDLSDLRFWDPGPGPFSPTLAFAGSSSALPDALNAKS